MTVRELIEKLQALDPQANVFVCAYVTITIVLMSLLLMTRGTLQNPVMS